MNLTYIIADKIIQFNPISLDSINRIDAFDLLFLNESSAENVFENCITIATELTNYYIEKNDFNGVVSILFNFYSGNYLIDFVKEFYDLFVSSIEEETPKEIVKYIVGMFELSRNILSQNNYTIFLNEGRRFTRNQMYYRQCLIANYGKNSKLMKEVDATIENKYVGSFIEINKKKLDLILAESLLDKYTDNLGKLSSVAMKETVVEHRKELQDLQKNGEKKEIKMIDFLI